MLEKSKKQSIMNNPAIHTTWGTIHRTKTKKIKYTSQNIKQMSTTDPSKNQDQPWCSRMVYSFCFSSRRVTHRQVRY